MSIRISMAVARVSVLLMLLAQAQVASADWHQGRVTTINFGYDGSTISFLLSGWSRSNCTCYPTWPSYMCLNRSRVSFKEEFAWLLKASAMDQMVTVYIDETSCMVSALSEA